jgi:hypothetical protein
MSAPTPRTLIAALVATVGLALFAFAPVALADVSADASPVPAADARAVAVADPATRPGNLETRARADADPAAARPFSAGRDDRVRARTNARTAGVDRPLRRRSRRSRRSR